MTRANKLLVIMAAALVVALGTNELLIDQRAREHIKTADEITAACVGYGYFEWKGNIYVCYLEDESSATTDT